MNNLKDFTEVINYFAIDKYVNSCSEEQHDEKLLQEIKSVVNECIQYHNFIIGEYSRYPDIFSDEYLILIVEHIKKKSIKADIKGILCYTVYLFPKSISHNAISIDLYKYGGGLNFIIITEAIKTFNSDYFTRCVTENDNLTPVHIGSIEFYNENRLPTIKPLGQNTLNGLLECFNWDFQDKMPGVNRIDIYLIGSNVDQFFYVHTNPLGERLLYKYNLLEGWLTRVDEFSSAIQESKGVIQHHIMSKLTEPQYSLECDVKPYVKPSIPVRNIVEFGPIPDDLINTISDEHIKWFAKEHGVKFEDVKNAIKSGIVDDNLKSAVNKKK